MKTEKIHSFSYIRVLACLSIVLLHILFASNVYFEEEMTQTEILVTKIIENMQMWSVPCFLMVSGALLLDPDREISPHKLFGRYLRRMVLALLVFTFLFQLMDYMAGDQDSLFTGWILNLYQGHSWAHMWYLYLMIGLYLMLPFYRMVTRQASERQLWYLTAVLVLFISVIPMGQIAGLDNGFYIPTSIIYPAYFFLGHLLRHRDIPAGKGMMAAAGSSVLIIVLTLLAYRDGSAGSGSMEFLFGYASILVVMQSAGMFALLHRIKAPVPGILEKLDESTFGIYLVHMAGVRAIMKWGGFNPYSYGPFAFAGIFLLIVLVSFAVVLLYSGIRKAIRIRRQPPDPASLS